MNKVRIRFSIIIALVIAFVFAIGISIGSLFDRKTAAAITYEPSKIFSAGGGSSVAAYKTGLADADAAYVGFSMKQDGGTVYYRRSLAFKWFESDTEASERGLANPGKAQYFSLKFSFPKVNFESFDLTFESDEENVSKSGKSTNKLSFSFNADNNLVVGLESSNLNATRTKTKESWVTSWDGIDFVLSFKEGKTAGEFALSLVYTDGTNTSAEYFEEAADREEFAFTNIGDNYAEYRSTSASKPNTPLTFTVNFPEPEKPAEGETPATPEQKVLIKELNGQSLEVKNYTVPDGAKEENGAVAVTGGNVEDTKAPALVLSETVYSFTLGQRYSLTHHAVDVLDDSVTVTRRYYIAKKGEDNEYVAPDESTTDDYKTLTTSVYFMPLDDTNDDEPAYISIRFELEDGRTRKDGEKDYVYLSWYADESAVSTQNGWDYVKAEIKKENPVYKVLYADIQTNQENVKSLNYDEVVNNYQELVDEAASKTSAGEGAYVYLPSLRDLIGSDSADYRNLKFSVYYRTQQQAEGASPLSETSLSYNNLKIPVNVDCDYVFRVLATDAQGNAIRLYNGKSGDRKEVVDVTGSNIFDIDDIPEFRFSVGYKGAKIETNENKDPGYRETTYNISSFDIIALSGYETDYSLSYFDTTLYKDGNVPSYNDLVNDYKKYMELMALDLPTDEEMKGMSEAEKTKVEAQKKELEEYKAKIKKYEECLVEIQEYNDEYSKDDEEWELTDNDYNWRPPTLSFNPQKSGFYVVQVTVSEANRNAVNGYQVIEIRNPLDVTPSRSNWLENNKTSVILFSISGVLAIAIVVLLVVKPSEKAPEDIDLDKLKGKKKNKPKKD